MTLVEIKKEEETIRQLMARLSLVNQQYALLNLEADKPALNAEKDERKRQLAQRSALLGQLNARFKVIEAQLQVFAKRKEIVRWGKSRACEPRDRGDTAT